MAWAGEVVACLVLLVTVVVLVPCVCVLCCQCNPEWRWSPCGRGRVEAASGGES